MAQGGLIGLGVKVAFATGSPHSWNKLEQVLDITPPQLTSAKVDVTVHGTSRMMRNIPGLQSVSDTVVKLLRDADPVTSPNQNQLFGYLASQVSLWWRVEIPSKSDITLFEAYEFQGRVADFVPMAPIGGRQEVDLKVMFNDASLVQYAPAASALP